MVRYELESVYKIRILGLDPGIQNILKTMDSRLRTPDDRLRGQAPGITGTKTEFMDRL